MMVMTVGFIFMLGGLGSASTIDVPLYFDASMDEEEQDVLLYQLNESDAFSFSLIEEQDAEKRVALGEIPYAIHATAENYEMLIAADDANHVFIDQYVRQVYVDELRLQQVEQSTEDPRIREEIDQNLSDVPLRLASETVDGEEQGGGIDQRNQALFGMTLFFSIYTIIQSLSKVAEEKRTGTWNRMILSPVRKWQVYLGHLCYAFLIGFLQIVIIFAGFKYLFGYGVGDSFGSIVLAVACYTFAIVALGMLMLGLVKTLEQLNAVVPIVAVSMAMIGGAYWPIELVSNSIILAISKVLPITYAMEALKQIASNNHDFTALAQPLSILLLFGVVCMGIGINLMERKM
ncbi:ABC transporter permease [Aquibacillus koreensis]|nr:ABC transporter permease [Aquibacillus koreensis]MCT2536679.1 ABC transporter permease [Aquibacillus koreensis]